MRRMLVVGSLVVMVLAGCGWTQTDFDSGRSRADALETKITAATAGSLELHSFPLAPSPLGVNPPALAAVVGNQLVTQQGADVVAYDATTCPRSDGGACTPLWTRTDSRFRASDGTHFVFTPGRRAPASSFEVTDAARNQSVGRCGAGLVGAGRVARVHADLPVRRQGRRRGRWVAVTARSRRT